MDQLLDAFIRQGGAWLTVGVLLVILAAGLKAVKVLLDREWARGDRQDAVISQLVGQQEKLLGGQERIERALDGLRSRAR